jgi:SAM-dependent methyltransferase
MDRWIVHRLGAVLRTHPQPVVVDLGFGASPVTTLELADRLAALRGVGRPVRVVGIEVDPERVASALGHARPGVEFRHGGFEAPLPGDARPLVIRAANVLRQYPEGEVAAAWRTMRDRLAPGGLLVEGTCDELGRTAAWVGIAAPGWDGQPVVPETLTISLALAHLDMPSDVAERLPKALIHHNVPGQPVHRLLTALDGAWQRSAPHGVFGPRQRWVAALEVLRSQGWPVLDGPARWRLGECTVGWSAVAAER